MEQAKRGLAAPRLLLVAMLTLALAFGALVASSLTPEGAGQAHAASLSKKSVTITKGKTYKLKLKKATAKKVKWSSSKKSVATVSKSGTVKAKKAGKATITAKYKGKKYKCKVTVKNPVKKQTDFQKVMSAIEKSPDSVTVSKGIKAFLVSDDDAAVIIASDSSDKSVKFGFVVENGGREVSITLIVHENSSAPAEILLETTDNGKLKTSATVDKSSYKLGKSLSWKVKENKGLGLSDKKATDMSDQLLSESIKAWNQILKLETGYTMSHLGFKNVK